MFESEDAQTDRRLSGKVAFYKLIGSLQLRCAKNNNLGPNSEGSFLLLHDRKFTKFETCAICTGFMFSIFPVCKGFKFCIFPVIKFRIFPGIYTF